MQFYPVMDTSVDIYIISSFSVSACVNATETFEIFFFFVQWTNVSTQLHSWKYPTLLWLKRTNTYCICKRFVLKHFKSLMMNKLFHPHHGEPNFYWHSRNTFSEDVEVWVSKLNCSSTFVCVCVYFCEDDSVSDKTSPTYNSPGTLQP